MLKIPIIMNIRNEKGDRINTDFFEKDEQDLAKKYIMENDTVLELGARYGSVSCVINSKLKCKTNQVVVEPDSRVWEALEKNRYANNCEFGIIKGFLSNKKLSLTNCDSYNGYAATSVVDDNTTIPSFSLEEITRTYNLTFNVLVADCEGFLECFFDENPGFYDNLRLVIFEADYANKCNYKKIKSALADKGFTEKQAGFQNVWLR